MVDAPAGYDTKSLPLTIDVAEEFYLKPDAGKLLISPANEDPEPPCDVQPDEMDIAICVDRIERAFDVSVKRVESPWAGLRSFVADKSPVAGFSRQGRRVLLAGRARWLWHPVRTRPRTICGGRTDGKTGSRTYTCRAA